MVKTYFDGALTQQQLISAVIALLAVVIILAFAKKVVKIILTIVVIAGVAVYMGFVSPKQLQDISTVVAKQGKEVFTQIAKTSKNVKVNTSNGLNVSVCVDGKWINVDDISSFVKVDKDTYSLSINGKDYSVTDEGVIEILDLLKK